MVNERNGYLNGLSFYGRCRRRGNKRCCPEWGVARRNFGKGVDRRGGTSECLVQQPGKRIGDQDGEQEGRNPGLLSLGPWGRQGRGELNGDRKHTALDFNPSLSNCDLGQMT